MSRKRFFIAHESTQLWSQCLCQVCFLSLLKSAHFVFQQSWNWSLALLGVSGARRLCKWKTVQVKIRLWLLNASWIRIEHLVYRKVHRDDDVMSLKLKKNTHWTNKNDASKSHAYVKIITSELKTTWKQLVVKFCIFIKHTTALNEI